MNDSKAPQKYTPSDYAINDRLYRAYRLCDLNEGMAELEANAISFPDYSCNWGRFSKAQDILNREKGLPTDGCFSFSVEVAQFEKMATPCHDPLPNNFSHTEVRQLKDDEPLSFEPSKNRKLESYNWSKTNRRRYRQNIINNLKYEFRPTA
jgi:hypothetical protein